MSDKDWDVKEVVDEDEFRVHVEFVREMIRVHKDRRDLWKKVRESTLGWLVIAILSGVGTLVYNGISWYMNRKLSSGS